MAAAAGISHPRCSVLGRSAMVTTVATTSGVAASMRPAVVAAMAAVPVMPRRHDHVVAAVTVMPWRRDHVVRGTVMTMPQVDADGHRWARGRHDDAPLVVTWDDLPAAPSVDPAFRNPDDGGAGLVVCSRCSRTEACEQGESCDDDCKAGHG